MRNYIGGWSATYDSCIAQRAIVGYGVLRGFEITAYNVRINLTSSSSTHQNHEPIVINDENLIETQVRDVERVFGVMYIDGFGNGYALIQMHVAVNVEFNDKVRRPTYAPFNIDVKPNLSGRNFSTIDYNVCIGWRAENVKNLNAVRSGTVFLEIQIPTGYRVEEKDLKVMIRERYIRNLREAENWPGQVNFGFEYVDVVPICFQFQAKRWIPVANVSRYYEIRAYEWFEPANMHRSIYTFRNLFALDICEVKTRRRTRFHSRSFVRSFRSAARTNVPSVPISVRRSFRLRRQYSRSFSSSFLCFSLDVEEIDSIEVEMKENLQIDLLFEAFRLNKSFFFVLQMDSSSPPDGYSLLPEDENENENENEDEEFLRFATARSLTSSEEKKATNPSESIWKCSLQSETFPVDDEKAETIKRLMSKIELPRSSFPAWAQTCSEDEWKAKLGEQIACRQTTFFHAEKTAEEEKEVDSS